MKFVIACGGTGGHLFPGLAVAEELRSGGHEVLLLVSEKSIDERGLRAFPGMPRETLPSVGLPSALSPAALLALPVKSIAAVAAILAAIAYDIFAGSEIATERSLIMTMIVFGAVLAHRRAISMRNLALAAVILILLEPETVIGPSFQMSFCAVMGLVALYERAGVASFLAAVGSGQIVSL